MRNYEAMFILKPDLKEEGIASVAKHIAEPIVKNQGTVSVSEVWSPKRRFCFPIKKYKEGIYYRVNFAIQPKAIETLKQAYHLNEDILRLLIFNLENN
ncbi:MAG: 30S ribosomal protein S6 [Candidatus Omnitrophota bacterium]|jgi:ribosomal protein S6